MQREQRAQPRLGLVRQQRRVQQRLDVAQLADVHLARAVVAVGLHQLLRDPLQRLVGEVAPVERAEVHARRRAHRGLLVGEPAAQVAHERLERVDATGARHAHAPDEGDAHALVGVHQPLRHLGGEIVGVRGGQHAHQPHAVLDHQRAHARARVEELAQEGLLEEVREVLDQVEPRLREEAREERGAPLAVVLVVRLHDLLQLRQHERQRVGDDVGQLEDEVGPLVAQVALLGDVRAARRQAALDERLQRRREDLHHRRLLQHLARQVVRGGLLVAGGGQQVLEDGVEQRRRDLVVAELDQRRRDDRLHPRQHAHRVRLARGLQQHLDELPHEVVALEVQHRHEGLDHRETLDQVSVPRERRAVVLLEATQLRDEELVDILRRAGRAGGRWVARADEPAARSPQGLMAAAAGGGGTP